MENNSTSCKLKISKNISSKTPAFLVNFSNGRVNWSSSNELTFTSCRHISDKDIISSKARRILVANNDRLNYKSFNNSNLDQSKSRYLIGVRNKTSGKMKMYDAMPFHMKRMWKTDIQSSANETGDIRERLDELTTSFGSKDQKRSMNARQKYSTNSAPLDHALEDMSLDESLPNTNHSISVTNASNTIEYIPPQNRNAKCVDDVFKINDIISAEEDEYLNKKTELLLQDLPTHLSEWKDENTYCEYVLNHLEGAVDIIKVKYLLYYNYLVTFSRLVASDIKKKDPAPQIPEPIKSNLLDCYTVSSVLESGKTVRSFPKVMKDKLLSYIIVLALLIDDYRVNLALVQKDIKYGASKISNVAQVLGCYVTRRKINNLAIQFAELKLPLFAMQRYKKF